MTEATGPAGPRAGIHLDGNIATVAILPTERSHPRLAEIRQTRGFAAADALAAAVHLVPPNTPIRVTLSTPAQQSATLEGPPALPSRPEFETAARRALTASQTTRGRRPELGALDDPELVSVAGNLPGPYEPGLVTATPTELVHDAHRALGGRPWAEVTAATLSAPWVDGAFLAMRRDTTELTLVIDGHTVAANHLVPAPGPEWIALVISEAAETLAAWLRAGYQLDGGLYVHGHLAASPGLDDLIAAAGLHRLEHPIAGLPHHDPLDAVDAYLAAAALGRDLPYAAYPAPVDLRPTPAMPGPPASPVPESTTVLPASAPADSSASSSAGVAPGSWTRLSPAGSEAAARASRVTVPTPRAGQVARPRSRSRAAVVGVALLLGLAALAYGLLAPVLARSAHDDALRDPDVHAAVTAAVAEDVRDQSQDRAIPAALVAVTARAHLDDVTVDHDGTTTRVVAHGTPAALRAWVAELENERDLRVTATTMSGASATLTVTRARS